MGKLITNLMCYEKQQRNLVMTFELDKYTKATFIRERLWEIYQFHCARYGQKIKKLDQEETYKYLGMEEGNEILHG